MITKELLEKLELSINIPNCRVGFSVRGHYATIIAVVKHPVTKQQSFFYREYPVHLEPFSSAPVDFTQSEQAIEKYFINSFAGPARQSLLRSIQDWSGSTTCGKKFRFEDLPPNQQDKARARFINAGSVQDTYLYELDKFGDVLCRVPSTQVE